MHQSTHDTTEAELQEALSNAAWWEQTCEYWHKRTEQAERERDFARHSTLDAHFDILIKLCEKKNCVFSIDADNEGTEDIGFEWRVRGPRGLNNASGPFSTIAEAVNDMLDWLETAQEKPL